MLHHILQILDFIVCVKETDFSRGQPSTILISSLVTNSAGLPALPRTKGAYKGLSATDYAARDPVGLIAVHILLLLANGL